MGLLRIAEMETWIIITRHTLIALSSGSRETRTETYTVKQTFHYAVHKQPVTYLPRALIPVYLAPLITVNAK